jgi:serine/threonine protein phosphatase 1
MGRTLAIGDIHGCAQALEALLDLLQLQAHDTLVTLGDYVDRGPDSRGVIELLLQTEQKCQLVPLLGNHEIMLLTSDIDDSIFQAWMSYGGQATLTSYGAKSILDLPESHREFLGRCQPYFERDTTFFVHAGYDEQILLPRTSEDALYWRSLRQFIPGPHISGKTAVVGHTPQSGGRVLDLGYLICLDTGCCYQGCLTAMDVSTREIWQVAPDGKPRVV